MRGDSPEFSSSTEDSLQRLKNYDWSCSLTNRFLIKCNDLFNAVLTEIQECVKNELHSMINHHYQQHRVTLSMFHITVEEFWPIFYSFAAIHSFMHSFLWKEMKQKTCLKRFPLINNLPHFRSMASNCLEIALLPFADWQLAAILL